MFALVENLVNFDFGPSVTAIGRIGGGTGPLSQDQISELIVPWQPLIPGSPSAFQLLSWHSRCSEFAGRDKEIEQLTAWAVANHPVWVKFVVGDGGVGKSRLGAEFAGRLKDRNWTAGFVDLRKECSFPMHRSGTLLVIDYPEERVVEVRELLRDLTFCQPPSPIRVLFLTRQAPDKWGEVISGANANNIVDGNPILLSRLGSSDATRIFNTTVTAALESLPGVESDPGRALITEKSMAAWIEQAPENQRALFIMAAAIRAAENPGSEIVEYKGREVVQSLARREVARLQGVAIGREMKDEFCLARLLAMAAIADELSLKDIMAIISEGNVPLGCKVSDDVQGELSTAGLLDGGVVRAPKPDILAAAFVVDALCQRPEYASEAVWAALEGEMSGSLARIGRLCWDAEIVLGIHDNRLSHWPAEAVEGNWGRADKVTDVLTDATLPQGLIRTSSAAWRTLAEGAPDDESRALFLNNLSVDLGSLGDNKAAMAAIRESVSIRRHLAADNPTRFEPGLASSLNNLSNELSAVGDTKAAQEAITEAVSIFSRLAADNPTRFEPDLAGSLNNLSNLLDVAGDTRATLDSIMKSVSIYRRLAADNPARFEPELAGSLNNLSNQLGAVGNTEAALKASKESVSIYRRLAADNPARVEPELALSLNNLSNRQAAVGNIEKALAAIEEAVAILGRLAANNPARFEPDLAMSLSVLGDVLRDDKRRDDAAQAYREAIALIRPYAEQWPGSRHGKLLRQTDRDLRELGES